MSAKPEADHVAPSPRKSKKMLLIVALTILVLGLAGAGGWFYLSKKHAALDEDGQEQPHAAPVSKAPPTYLPIDNMVVNLADPGGEKVAQVGVTLELLDVKSPDKVKVYLPAIRSGILMLISQRTAEELLLREGKEKLAADILEEAAKHFASKLRDGKSSLKSSSKEKHDLDTNPVQGVLFSSFIIQ